LVISVEISNSPHTHVLNPEGWRLLITVLVPVVVTVVVAIAAVSKAVCRKQTVT
jgi:hypothetical protein